jgi:DNA-binding CsgD family transcriptional regulator
VDFVAALIGRADVLAAVTSALRAAQPVAIVGEAGIGKTSVVRAAAARTGRALHEGGGFATLSWLPYLALRRAIPLAETAAPAAAAAAARQAVGHGLLFIDDLQWADESSRAVVDLLLGTIAVAVAIRTGEPQAEAVIERIRARGALIVWVPALDGRSALELATRAMPGAAAPHRRRVIQAAGGNPLLIEELGAHGDAPSWLTRAVLRQVDCLPTAGRRALNVVATAARPVPLSELGNAGAVLLERGLLDVRPDGVTVRHRFMADALRLAPPPAAARTARGSGAGALDRRVSALAAGIAAGHLAAVAADAAALLSKPLATAARRQAQASRILALGLLGRAEEAELAIRDNLAPEIDGAGGDAALLASCAEALLWGGLSSRAHGLAEEALRTAGTVGEQLLPSLTRAWAQVDLGRAPAAPSSADARLGPGAAAELRGLAALGEDQPAAAAVSFESAGRAWAGRDLPRELVCRWAAGEARRRLGDRDAAAALRTTLAAASATGFEPLAARVRRSLRLAGDRPATQRPQRLTGDPLTARERQILELVERGRTNPEIARRMGLGRPTVARILSNAMTRLGAQSRAHAVVLAAENPSDWGTRDDPLVR